jgi:hypothetical protein
VALILPQGCHESCFGTGETTFMTTALSTHFVAPSHRGSDKSPNVLPRATGALPLWPLSDSTMRTIYWLKEINYLVILMLSIKEICNPTYNTSQPFRAGTFGGENENSNQYSGETRVVRKRKRFTLEERFEIITELKYRNFSMETIAIAYKTSVRNVARWKALYGSFEKRMGLIYKLENASRYESRKEFNLKSIHTVFPNM